METITPEDVAEMLPISFTQNDNESMGMYSQARGEADAGYLDNVIEKAKQIDKKDYGVDVRMNGWALISEIYDSILMEEIQAEHDLLLSDELKLREYIEWLDDIEELAGDMPVDEWIKTDDARRYVCDPRISFESRKQCDPNEESIIDEAWKIMNNAVNEYIADKMKLFEEIAESQGFAVIDEEESRLSNSQYLSMTHTHNIDEYGDLIDEDKVYKVRFSDHEDMHGGNDLNLSFEDSAEENAIELYEFLKSKKRKTNILSGIAGKYPVSNTSRV
ncbi:MAG: hypothetical protein EOM40_19355 [Clostridia bacterium]|jgi:hypothetical protein|nr:hypothetical protein [Clostridia bacterium]NCD09910.1 hypothetical protein [Negativicutes bacterium]